MLEILMSQKEAVQTHGDWETVQFPAIYPALITSGTNMHLLTHLSQTAPWYLVSQIKLMSPPGGHCLVTL